MTALLHSHVDAENTTLLGGLLNEVLLDALIDTLKIIPFLFLTYLLMEFIEHKASGKTVALLERSGKAGPAIGGILGALPQCAFSAVAANLYTGRVISLGTLIAVFLSTSDEMLPIMISSGARWQSILIILAYKLTVGIIAGFAIDLVMHLLRRDKEKIDIDEICDNDNCHCERGLFFSALHHTLTISAFILAVTLVINALVFFVGEETLGNIVSRIPVLSHLIAAIIGLIPGCATSVALTTLGLEGIISGGTMMAGLFSSAGVGVIILARLNRRPKENLVILGLLVGIGFAFGLLFDFFNFALVIA
jgi:hypothetical protein